MVGGNKKPTEGMSLQTAVLGELEKTIQGQSKQFTSVQMNLPKEPAVEESRKKKVCIGSL